MPFTDNSGYVWKEYSIKFESPEGTFSTSIWAVSFEHANLQLQALKETGTVDGEIVGRVKGGAV